VHRCVAQGSWGVQLAGTACCVALELCQHMMSLSGLSRLPQGDCDFLGISSISISGISMGEQVLGYMDRTRTM
jgi:hypothetical protein